MSKVAGGAAGALEGEGDVEAVVVDETEVLRVQELQQKVQALRAQAAAQVCMRVCLGFRVQGLGLWHVQFLRAQGVSQMCLRRLFRA
jgi:hypothetical protein